MMRKNKKKVESIISPDAGRGITPLTFTGVLSEIKMDRFGEWKVSFTVPQIEISAMTRLGEHTEKALQVKITPPDKDIVFGSQVESD